MEKRGSKDNKKEGPSPAKEPEKKPESKPKDFSTAILDSKKAPHRLIAEEGIY